MTSQNKTKTRQIIIGQESNLSLEKKENHMRVTLKEKSCKKLESSTTVKSNSFKYKNDINSPNGR